MMPEYKKTVLVSPETTAEDSVPLHGAFLVGLSADGQTDQETRESLDELAELVRTLRKDIAGTMTARVRMPDSRYYVGSGKAEEIRDEAANAHAECLVFDFELSASQQRNMEKLCGRKVLDRQEVILDIFAARARTKEAVLQVELARNKYYLPRLTRAWSHLSRQKGGAMGTRGEGEKQLEYDKRMVRRKIAELEEDLADVRRRRGEQRKERIRRRVPHAAIVGYTNAGKSSLLNKLTGSAAYVEDQLFATLDPTTRRLNLPNGNCLLLTDTVGFVRRLPHALVESFKSTLEEALLADFLVMVLDASSPNAEIHRETTLRVLEELGGKDKPILTVFNKCDRLTDPAMLARLRAAAPDGVCFSCVTGEGTEDLFGAFQLYLRKCTSIHDLRIPPEHPELVALLHSKCTILESRYSPEGFFLCAAAIPDSESERFHLFCTDDFSLNNNISETTNHTAEVILS